MKKLHELGRKGLSAIIFVLLIFTLNIHCGSDGKDVISSDPDTTSAQSIEQSLEQLAAVAENPTSNDPAVREDELDYALRIAISEIFYYSNKEMEENDLTRTMVFDISRYLLKIHDYTNTSLLLRNLNFLDLNGDGTADQANGEFITIVRNLSAIFGNIMGMEELADYNPELQSGLEGLLNIIRQIENINSIITVLDSVVIFMHNNLANLFSNSAYDVIEGLEDAIYTLKLVLSGDISSQALPSVIDDLVPRYEILAERLREEMGGSYSMDMPLLSGSTYRVWTNDTLAKYIDGYEKTTEDGEDVLTVDPDMMGGLIGILEHFRSLLGSMVPVDSARLTHLATSAGTLTPVFDGDTLTYSVLVPRNIASITVTPIAHGSDMDVTVNSSPVTSGFASQPVALATDFYTTITIQVTDSASGTSRTYTVSARRMGDSTATLANLGLSAGTLVPDFRADRLDYSVEVDHDITEITVTPTSASEFSSITINGTTVASGSPSSPVALSVGTNLITVQVTAEDVQNTCTYTISVKRLGSHNASLSNIVLSQGTLSPAFNAETLNYSAEVENAVTSLTVTPTVAEPHAMLNVNGVAVASGQAVQINNLLVGNNPIRIVATAQDGITTNIYNVNVYRKPSSNAKLAGLTISQGTLAPAFAAGTTSYSATVVNAVTSLTVTPTVEDNTATVRVNNAAVTSGSASQAINLATGPNTVTIAVTAQDGVTVRTYTVTVTRQKSSNAALSGLSISQGTLSPAFAAATLSYTAKVVNSVTSLTVTPTAADGAATITVNGSAVNSGSASQAINLATGNNSISIAVMAEDGVTSRTYTVTVNRMSNNAYLTGLNVRDCDYDPSFSPTTYEYTDGWESLFTTGTRITAWAAHSGAVIRVNGRVVASGYESQYIDFGYGWNTITINVTSEDGTVTRTYYVYVFRM